LDAVSGAASKRATGIRESQARSREPLKTDSDIIAGFRFVKGEQMQKREKCACCKDFTCQACNTWNASRYVLNKEDVALLKDKNGAVYCAMCDSQMNWESLSIGQRRAISAGMRVSCSEICRLLVLSLARRVSQHVARGNRALEKWVSTYGAMLNCSVCEASIQTREVKSQMKNSYARHGTIFCSDQCRAHRRKEKSREYKSRKNLVVGGITT
jgi:transcription elongation factor Elf1